MAVIHHDDFAKFFADAFIEDYGDWEDAFGTTTNLTVSRDRDRLEFDQPNVDLWAKWNGPNAPTGDQEITCKVAFAGDFQYFGPAGRISANATGYTASLSTQDSHLWRVAANSFTALDGMGGNQLGDGTVYEAVLRITGTNPVLLTVIIDGVTVVEDLADSSASRIESGLPGVQGYSTTVVGASGPYIDDWSVDDLTDTDDVQFLKAEHFSRDSYQSVAQTCPVTIPADADYVRVYVSMQTGADNTLPEATSGVTVDGVAASLLDRQGAGLGTATGIGAEIWELVAPATGAVDVVVGPFNATVTTVITVVAYKNVDQTTPSGTPVKATGTGTAIAAPNIVSGTGNLVTDCVAIQQNDPTSLAAATGQATRTNAFAWSGSSYPWQGVSDEPGVASVDMEWVAGASCVWCIVAAEIRKAGAGGGGTAVELASTTSSTSTLTAGLNVARGFSSQLASISTIDASLALLRSFTSQLTSTSSLVASLSTNSDVVLSATLATLSAISASLGVSRPLGASLSSESILAASVARQRGFSASATSTSALSASIGAARPFSALLSSTSLIEGRLTSSGDVAVLTSYLTSRRRFLLTARVP